MSTGGPDQDCMIEIDGDMHRLTSRLRWVEPQYVKFTILMFDGRMSRKAVLEQAWQNVRTGELVWRPVDIEP